jgi:hypothetical protein
MNSKFQAIAMESFFAASCPAWRGSQNSNAFTSSR